MTTSWNLEGLRQHIAGMHPSNGEALLALESLARAVKLFRFHIHETRSLLGTHLDAGEPHSVRSIDFVLGPSTVEAQKAVLAAEANLIAGLHHARGMWDIFGFLVNILCLSPPLPSRSCYIHTVQQGLPSSDLKIQLGSALDSSWYKYVSAFINTSKHRLLIESTRRADFEENRVGMRVTAFNYGSSSFPAYWFEDVVKGAIELQNQILPCGIALSGFVGVNA
jgi:hypothetical protein